MFILITDKLRVLELVKYLNKQTLLNIHNYASSNVDFSSLFYKIGY